MAVLFELARIALADPRKIVDATGKLLPLHKLDPDTAAAISSVEHDLRTGSIRYKFWDKNTALEKCMRHMGLFEKDNRQKTDPVAELLAFIHKRGSRFAIAESKDGIDSTIGPPE